MPSRAGLLFALCAALAWPSSPMAAPDATEAAVAPQAPERSLLRPAEGPALMQSVRDTASDLVMSAMSFLGVPYRRGGASEDQGFDCSGFTRHIFETSLGLVLPRSAHEQAATDTLTQVPRSELKPGDLVFFNTMRRTFSHVGIYLGDNKFIHAPRSGALVRIEDMTQSYWARRYTGARRADAVATGTPAL